MTPPSLCEFYIEGNQLNVDVLFWCLVKSDLSSVRFCTRVPRNQNNTAMFNWSPWACIYIYILYLVINIVKLKEIEWLVIYSVVRHIKTTFIIFPGFLIDYCFLDPDPRGRVDPADPPLWLNMYCPCGTSRPCWEWGWVWSGCSDCARRGLL